MIGSRAESPRISQKRFRTVQRRTCLTWSEAWVLLAVLLAMVAWTLGLVGGSGWSSRPRRPGIGRGGAGARYLGAAGPPAGAAGAEVAGAALAWASAALAWASAALAIASTFFL